jgi:DNA-binding SARP family transcriptional activator
MASEYRILGPLEVHLGARGTARVPAGNVRRLLCLLLIHRGQVVPFDAIVDALWAEAPPANARNALQIAASRLRAAIGAETITARGGGYGIRIEPGTLDADRFETLTGRGHRELAEGSPGEAAATLAAALALWRGPVLADVRGDRFAEPEIARIDALRLLCTTDRIAAVLAAGADAPLAELEALVLEHPLDERVRQLHMLALYRSGRQADALAAYRAARRALLDGLGLEPGQGLRTLEAEILSHQVVERESPPLRPAAPGGDRRTVTCLFVRLVAPEGAADADPEALRTLARRYHREIEAACLRHGGMVAELRTTGALTVFGLPTAHEDDPLRAVRAGVELAAAAARLGEGMASAGGVATGVVVPPDREDGPLFGEPVTTAEDLARGHRDVRISRATRGLVEHAVRGEPLRDGSYRLDGLVADAPAIRRTLDRPLVGRAGELRLLGDAYRRAQAAPSWIVVTVLGEPGIGKSRLAVELASVLPAGVTILHGRCPAYGADAAHQTLREIVMEACAGRSPAAASAALGLPPEAGDRLAAIVGLGPGSVGDETPWALRRLLDAVAGETPAVVVLDDVHWAGPGLLELMGTMTTLPGHGGGLLVCLARPELRDSHPTWFGGRRDVVELGPLSAEESLRLLETTTGGRLDAAARARVVQTAAGNPLFLEELAAFADEQPERGDLPPAIQALLAARLDALDPSERAVLCYGSIGGEGFTAGSIHALAEGAPLAEIEVACISLRGRGFVSGSGPHRFRHALIRETAYESLSKTARARLHERHAQWLAAQQDVPADASAHIGRQLEAAYRCLREIEAPDAADVGRRARQALSAAARDAHRRGDLPGEIGLLERAIRFDEPPAVERAAQLPTLAAALFAAGSFDRASAVADEAVTAGRAIAAPVIHARGMVERERLAVYRHQATIDVAASQRVAERAVATLTELGDDLGAARAHYLRCELLWMGGDPEAGYASARRMLECATRAESGFEASAATAFMAWSLVHGTTPVDEALGRCDELSGLVAGDLVEGLEIAGFRAVLLAMAGRLGEARREMAASRRGLVDLGLHKAGADMALFDAQLEMLAGDGRAAEQAVRAAEVIAADTGDLWSQATVRVDLALAVVSQGTGAAAEAAVDAIDSMPAPADAEWVLKRHRARAVLAAGRKALPAAVAEARAAVAAADSTTMLLFRADAHRTLADVLHAAADAAEAAAEAEVARRLYAAKGVTAAIVAV